MRAPICFLYSFYCSKKHSIGSIGESLHGFVGVERTTKKSPLYFSRLNRSLGKAPASIEPKLQLVVCVAVPPCGSVSGSFSEESQEPSGRIQVRSACQIVAIFDLAGHLFNEKRASQTESGLRVFTFWGVQYSYEMEGIRNSEYGSLLFGALDTHYI